MKKLKLRLDELREEVDILNMDDLSTFKGGTGSYYGYSTWNEFTTAITNGQVPDGTYYPDGVSGGYGVHDGYAGQWYTTLTGGYQSFGGYASSTPSDPKTTELNSEVMSKYSNFMFTHTDTVLLSGTNVPAGYTINASGEYVDTSGGICYGVTERRDSKTYVYISPYVMTDSNLNEASRQGLIGHELTHVANIKDHAALYATNRAQFNLNSEYAAHSNQEVFAKNIGDPQTDDAMKAEMTRLQNLGADTTWNNKLTGF